MGRVEKLGIMSGGTDNPAFNNDDENSVGKVDRNNKNVEEKCADREEKTQEANGITENGHRTSFVTQHYIEPIRTNNEQSYKTETRIEVPAENNDKNNVLSPTKVNGVHPHNANNNDTSFLNTSTASIQSNGEFSNLS